MIEVVTQPKEALKTPNILWYGPFLSYCYLLRYLNPIVLTLYPKNSILCVTLGTLCIKWVNIQPVEYLSSYCCSS